MCDITYSSGQSCEHIYMDSGVYKHIHHLGCAKYSHTKWGTTAGINRKHWIFMLISETNKYTCKSKNSVWGKLYLCSSALQDTCVQRPRLRVSTRLDTMSDPYSRAAREGSNIKFTRIKDNNQRVHQNVLCAITIETVYDNNNQCKLAMVNTALIRNKINEFLHYVITEDLDYCVITKYWFNDVVELSSLKPSRLHVPKCCKRKQTGKWHR